VIFLFCSGVELIEGYISGEFSLPKLLKDVVLYLLSGVVSWKSEIFLLIIGDYERNRLCGYNWEKT